VAEVAGLLQAIELVDDVRIDRVYQECISCNGPPTGVYVKRSNHPGLCALSYGPQVELDQSLIF
jgi:hypothetical protein